MTPQQLAALNAIDENVRLLRASLADPVPAPPPPVEPPAPIPPAPIPPAPIPIPEGVFVRTVPLNLALVLCPERWYRKEGAYDRRQSCYGDRRGVVKLRYFGHSFSGNVSVALPQVEMTLEVDGVEVARATPVGASVEFSFDLSAHPPGGPYWLNVKGCAPFNAVPWPLHVLGDDGEMPAQSLAAVVRGTHRMQFPHVGAAQGVAVGAVPARWAPTVVPLKPRSVVASAELPHRSKLAGEWLVPLRYSDNHRINVTPNGVWNTANAQAYHQADFEAAIPIVPLLDGPRGKGNLQWVTHIAPSLRQGSKKLYFCDPWRVGVIAEDGHITTLAGYRHASPPHSRPAPRELVGDWSAVPAQRRGFHLLWGMAWDQRTLEVDASAPLIGGEHPHAVGPRMFLTDSMQGRPAAFDQGRVCLLTFSGTDRSVAPKVTEFIAGLREPWDVVYHAGRIYVSERRGGQVLIFDADTAASLGSITGFTRPEGLFELDGWLYIGDSGARRIEKVNITTGERLTAVTPTTLQRCSDNNTHFYKIAVSDGTFGPRGMIALMSWTVLNSGHPHLFAPDGKWIESWQWGAGPGIRWEGSFMGYGTAVGIGQGAMTWGNSYESLFRVSKATAEDKALPAAYYTGEAEFNRKHYDMLHGPHGFGYAGLPLPWGESPEMDVYLAAHGHVQAPLHDETTEGVTA